MTPRDALYRIISDIAGNKPPISDKIRLCQDLSIMGDDAWELLTRINGEFGTLFECFDFQAYFPNESEALCWHIGRWFGFRYPKTDITVGHLLAVIEKGRWFDP